LLPIAVTTGLFPKFVFFMETSVPALSALVICCFFVASYINKYLFIKILIINLPAFIALDLSQETTFQS